MPNTTENATVHNDDKTATLLSEGNDVATSIVPQLQALKQQYLDSPETLYSSTRVEAATSDNGSNIVALLQQQVDPEIVQTFDALIKLIADLESKQISYNEAKSSFEKMAATRWDSMNSNSRTKSLQHYTQNPTFPLNQAFRLAAKFFTANDEENMSALMPTIEESYENQLTISPSTNASTQPSVAAHGGSSAQNSNSTGEQEKGEITTSLSHGPQMR